MDDEHALLNTRGASFPELSGANVIEPSKQPTNSASDEEL